MGITEAAKSFAGEWDALGASGQFFAGGGIVLGLVLWTLFVWLVIVIANEGLCPKIGLGKFGKICVSICISVLAAVITGLLALFVYSSSEYSINVGSVHRLVRNIGITALVFIYVGVHVSRDIWNEDL